MRNTIIALLIVAFPLSLFAQDFDKGSIAAQTGDFKTALKEWTFLAEQGNKAAQFNLGIMYHQGTGVPQDIGEAIKWYILAAEQGHADAQSNLGNIYMKNKESNFESI